MTEIENEPLLENQDRFFAISVPKLSVMCFFTLGLYAVYWSYRHWDTIKKTQYLNINPPARAWFGAIFIYDLMNKIKNSSIMLNLYNGIPVGLLSILYILCLVGSRSSGIFGILFLLGSVLFLIPVQNLANKINAKLNPNGSLNDSFSVKDVLVILTGLMLSALVLVGALQQSQ